jgi:hypothetical protein
MILLLSGDEKRKLFWGSLISFIISMKNLEISFDWSISVMYSFNYCAKCNGKVNGCEVDRLSPS